MRTGSANQGTSRKRQLKVLFFDDRHYAAQGAQKILVQLARFAQDAGHDVTVASTREGALLELARANGIHTVALGTPDKLDQWGGLLSGSVLTSGRLAFPLLRQNLRLAWYVRREGFDTVWAAAMRPMLSLIATSLMTRAAVVWHIMSNAYFPMFNEVASLAAKRIVLISDNLAPTIGKFHSTRRMLRRTTTLPAAVAEPPIRDATREDLAEQLAITPGGLRKSWIVSIGGFVPEKGHLDVIQAVGAMSDDVQDNVLLLIGGPQTDAGYVQEVKDAAASSRAEILIHDWVEDADAWMRAADIFVLASRREGMPLVLIEAMNRGAVAVSYPVGAVPDLIQGGDTGLLVDQGSIDGLAAAIESLATAPARRKEMAANAQRFVQERHSIEVMRRSFNQILTETT